MPRGEVKVIEAFATSPAAERELWRFLHGIDLIVRVDVFNFDPARRCRCSSATRARSGCGSATGSGCASSTSTRR